MNGSVHKKINLNGFHLKNRRRVESSLYSFLLKTNINVALTLYLTLSPHFYDKYLIIQADPH